MLPADIKNPALTIIYRISWFSRSCLRSNAWATGLWVIVPFSLATASENASLERCWLEKLRLAGSDSRTVVEIKQQCRSELESALRIERPPVPAVPSIGVVPAGDRARFNQFFEPYKDTFLLLGAMRNDDGSNPFSGNTADIKFQLGLKFRLFPNLPGLENLAPLYFGYSQQSWWDVAESSAPFREHNYNPEIFWDYSKTSNLNGLNIVGRLIDRVGFEHQSNGAAGGGSRGWDRLYMQRQFQLGDRLKLGIKAWNVINRGDQNNDITDYLGNIRVNAAFQANDRLTIRSSAVQGWETRKLSYQLDLIYQIPEWVNSQFMLSYYEGYGEALISYNRKTSSLRAGLHFPISFGGL